VPCVPSSRLNWLVAARPGPSRPADRETKQFENFVLTETELGGLPAVRMDYDTTRFAAGKYFVRDYFVVVHNVVLEFALGTYTPESDASVFDEMAARFRVL
jgi:hypothetical protein